MTRYWRELREGEKPDRHAIALGGVILQPHHCGEDQPKPRKQDAASPTGELVARITEYLVAGGLFNPEMMEHEKVRDLLMDCRDALTQPKPRKAEAALYAEDAATPTTGTPCHVIGPSSRICEHGTKSCEVRHTKHTGGWTVASDKQGEFGIWIENKLFVSGLTEKQAKRLADAHCTALAAERKEVRIMTNQCVQLRQELAAEREQTALDYNNSVDTICSLERDIQQLREQMAERERWERDKCLKTNSAKVKGQ